MLRQERLLWRLHLKLAEMICGNQGIKAVVGN